MHRVREWRAIIFIFLFFHVCKSKNPISSELGSDLVVHQGSSGLPCVPFFSPHFFASFLLAFLRSILLLINSANLLYSPLSPPPEAFIYSLLNFRFSLHFFLLLSIDLFLVGLPSVSSSDFASQSSIREGSFIFFRMIDHFFSQDPVN